MSLKVSGPASWELIISMRRWSEIRPGTDPGVGVGQRGGGVCRSETTRLIGRYPEQGTVRRNTHRQHRFTQRYTRAGVEGWRTAISRSSPFPNYLTAARGAAAVVALIAGAVAGHDAAAFRARGRIGRVVY